MSVRAPKAAAAAALTLGAGWGVMNLLWIRADRMDVRGLYDDLAPTVGDGLILPVMAYSLACLGQLLPRRRTRRGMLVGSALGVILGVGITSAWLADPDPRLNWTLLRAGQFTAAGWYHAAFMVAALAWFTSSFLDRLARLRTATTYQRAVVAHFVVVLSCAAAFGALLLIDNLRATNLSSSVTVAGATFLLGVAFTELFFVVQLERKMGGIW